MTGTSSARTLSRLWFLLIGIVAITVLYLAKVLFLPLAFAILFAFLLTPVVSLLERARLSRALASVVVIAGFAILLGTAGWTLFTQLVDVANDLPTYRDNIENKMAAIHSPSDSAFSRAEREVDKLGEELGAVNAAPVPETNLTAGKDGKKPLGATPQRPVQVREVARPTGRLDQLGGVLEPLTTGFLSVVFTFFVLLQREDLRNRLIRLSGDRNLTVMTQAMHDASRRISRYFSLQLAVNVVYGLAFGAVLYFIHLPHALLFGTLAGLCRFIPFVGPPIAALVPTVLSLAVFHGWTNSLVIVGTFVVLELVTANFAEPRIYGKHTGLSALAILVAAAFWTLIWGPVGLVLSVPLTVCLVVMGRHVPSLEFLTVMLGDKPAIPPWTSFYQRLLARDEREAGEILETSLKDRSLEEAYDEVLIPALILSEEDRLHGDLEEGTVRFIRNAARDLIDEVGFKENAEAERAASEGLVEGNGRVEDEVFPLRVMCVPVRDEADELAACMLCQSLGTGRVKAFTAPVRRMSEVLQSVAEERPDIVVLSGLPPFGIARSHRMYRSMRARNPQLRVMVGIWNYAGDANAVAQEIGRGEEVRVLTRLTEAVAEVRAMARGEAGGPTARVEAAAVGALPDRSAA
jgi:predicted PurR-regulated permease PerM